MLFVLAAIALEIFVDLYGWYRIESFDFSSQTIQHVEGTLWSESVRKHGTLFRLSGKEGTYEFACDFPGLGGLASCDYNGMFRSGVNSQVHWIWAPSGLLSGTERFPLRIVQGGNLALSIEANDIRAIQARKLYSDLWFYGAVEIVLGLIAVVLYLIRSTRTR